MSENRKLPSIGERVQRNFVMADLRAISPDEENPKYNISGHAAVFEQVTNIGGYFYEVIERGAMDQTDFSDVLFSVNHDLHKIPLARSRTNNIQSTLQLNVDDIGLAVDANLDVENNTEAKSLYSSISRGDMDGMSFIFFVKDQKWENLDTEMPTRRIMAIDKVIEVSAVSFPAYDGTNISVDARDRSVLDSARRLLENARSQFTSKEEPQEDALELERLRAQTLLDF